MSTATTEWPLLRASMRVGGIGGAYGRAAVQSSPDKANHMTAWIDFECYRKRGKGWQYLGTYEGEDSHKAARKAAHIHNLKVVGARPSDTNVKLFVYRFENVPHLTGC